MKYSDGYKAHRYKSPPVIVCFVVINGDSVLSVAKN
jgi:hypothetical protein